MQLFRNETNEWYHVFVNGEEIVCTGGHPFYVVGLDKFLPARELKLYEKVLLSDGSYGTIDSIGIEALLEPEVTYNFEVADYHTYYVGECNVLVHNMCRNPGGRHGGKAHRQKVKKIKEDLVNKGWDVSGKEVGLRTANNKLRYPDITATKDGITRYYQIGKQTKLGKPISRELRALRDIGNTRTGQVFFIPYNV